MKTFGSLHLVGDGFTTCGIALVSKARWRDACQLQACGSGLRLLCLLLLLLLLAVPAIALGQPVEVLSAEIKGSYPQAELVKGSDGAFYGTTVYGGASGFGTVFRVTEAGVLTTLVSFNETNGAYPYSGLVEGRDGAFYGTTLYGGTSNEGTVFKITRDGELTTLVSFNSTNGRIPYAGLVEGSDGAFYGTTVHGGPSDEGTVFRVTREGELTTLFSFNGANGSYPHGRLVEGNDGIFYGTTSSGGASRYHGTVFMVTATRKLTTLVSFNGTNGGVPHAGLVKGRDGVFYGTTTQGGQSSDGTVFKVTADGSLKTLASFDNDTVGGVPYARLLEGSDGAFYGTTTQGGPRDSGSVFKVTPDGVLSRLFYFEGFIGDNRAGLVEGSNGTFYGTTPWGGIQGNGSVFKMPSVGKTTTLVTFDINPGASLVEGSDGTFYGTSVSDWTVNNRGTVFKVTPDGELTTLVSFNGTNGRDPYGKLVEGGDGAFYGTTYFGGPKNYGTVFKITPQGTLTTLVSFTSTNGEFPRAGLVRGSDHAFYGTASSGGANDLGTVFKVTADGELTTLVSFNGTNGDHPDAALVAGNDGTFYGTTVSGGANGSGTVFKMTPAGELTTLVSFNDINGSYPRAELVKGSDGAFYGTTYSGGASGLGTVFKVTADGELTTVASFDGTNGSNPEAGLVKGIDGTLYGITTRGGARDQGTLFKVAPAGVLTAFYSFDGKSPHGTPLFGSDGDLYGTADQMTIWRLVLSSAPSVTTNIADAISTTAATLHGSVNPSGATTSVWVEYGTSTAYGSSTAVEDIGADGSNSVPVSQSLTLLPHTTYHFRVVAQNAKGTTYGEDQSFTTLNSIPIATADIVEGAYAERLVIPVLANDSDADGDTLTLVSFTQPAHGEVVRAGEHSNVLVYIPQLGFSGLDSLTYTVSDGYAQPVLGTVEITVGARSNPSSSMVLNTGASVPGAGEEGRGIPLGATWRSFGAPAINDAGQVTVLGTWKSTEGNGSGIFVDDQLVIKAGDPVPGIGSATFKSFTDPLINLSGRVAFLATISGPGMRKGNDTVLVSDAFSGELEVVAREGDIAPETDDARLGKFYSISLRSDLDGSGLLFTASLLKGSGKPKVTLANDLGAWLRTPSLGATPRKVVREGDPGFAEGEKIKSFQLLNTLSGSPGQDRGHYAVDEAKFLVTFAKRQALVRFSEGALEADEFTGEPMDTGLYWRSFGMPATGSYGEGSAMRAVVQLGSGGSKKTDVPGIFHSIGQGMEFSPVARVGDEAFGVTGAVFSGFKDPLVSAWYGAVAFQSTIKGQGVRATNNTGIWWVDHSGWRLVARTGSHAADTPEGALWKSFNSLAMPDGERGPLFVASLARGAGSVNASNDTGLWAMDSVGEVRLLARERDSVGAKMLKSFSTLQAVSGSAGVRRSFNDRGQMVYRAYFTDGSQGIVKVQVP